MSVLKVHLTYQCTAACSHCRFGCSPRPTPVIDYDTVMETVRILRATNGLDLVVLMGGEPGLYPDLTHQLTADIFAMGVGVRIETNASWAADDAAASAFLSPLYVHHASVMFSLDAFHEPFVPPTNVARAVRISDKLGGRYNLEMAYLGGPGGTTDLDRRNDALLQELERDVGRSPVCPLYQGPVLFVGRAPSLASVVSAGRGVPNEPCPAVFWWMNGEQDTLDLLILDPSGYLSKGCGISIGNVRHQSVEQILSCFDAQQHPILSILLRDGPLGLAREAAELGYVLRSDYADRCHLCQEARLALRNRYREWLAPDIHYQSWE